VVAIPFFGIDEVKNFGNEARASVELLKFFQAFQSFFLFVLPPLVLARLFGQQPLNYLKLSTKPVPEIGLMSILLVIVVLPVINYAQYINSHLSLPAALAGLEQWMRATEESVNQLTEKFLSTTTPGGLLINILIMAVIPAIGEELTFRGLFQNIFSRWLKSYHAGIWLSAILFSTFHFQFFGFLPRLLLGVMFGYVVVWTHHLGYAILMHFTNNLMGVVFYFLLSKGMITGNPDNIGVSGNSSTFLLWGSVILSALILYSIYRYKHK
jgi:membrane protease YdiL (CAAX protease family)